MRAPLLLLGEALDRRPDRPPEDVVGEHDEDALVADEALGEPERLGDAAGAVLVGVGEPVDAVLLSVREQPQELAGVGAAGDDHDLVDPGLHERLDGVGDHRPVVDGEQVLVRDPRERVSRLPVPPASRTPFNGLRPPGRVIAGSVVGRCGGVQPPIADTASDSG